LSTLLDTGLALASEWLATPAGMIIGIASVVGAVALRPFVAFWATLLWRRATRWR
jgi:hypothetical protein